MPLYCTAWCLLICSLSRYLLMWYYFKIQVHFVKPSLSRQSVIQACVIFLILVSWINAYLSFFVPPASFYCFCLCDSISLPEASGLSARWEWVCDGQAYLVLHRWGARFLWGGCSLLLVSGCCQQKTPGGGEHHLPRTVAFGHVSNPCLRKNVSLITNSGQFFSPW